MSTHTIAVLGAGQMGGGMATLLAEAGHDVRIWDIVPAAAERVAAASKDKLVAVNDLSEAVTGATVIFEAIAEDMQQKLDVYASICQVNTSAIVASNTSSLPADRLSAGISNQARFAIAHFFNPPQIVPLVELVPGPQTSEGTLSTLADILSAAGKIPVRLQKAVPGFVANRLQAALLREAFALVDEGVATFEDVDLVVRSALGARWAAAGPMMVTDLGGLDIWTAVTTQLFPLLCNSQSPPKAITTRKDRGELGAKTGKGLYEHTPEEDERVKDRIKRHFELEFGG